MPAIGFAIPIAPGKVDEHRQLDEEVMSSRRDEYEASRKRLGIRRESAWHQETPDGTVAVVYIEADDPGAAMAGMGSLEEPFDSWFRERIFDIFGLDLTQPHRRWSRLSTRASSQARSDNGAAPMPAHDWCGLVSVDGGQRVRRPARRLRSIRGRWSIGSAATRAGRRVASEAMSKRTDLQSR